MYNRSNGGDMIVSALGRKVIIEEATGTQGFKIHVNGVSVKECQALMAGDYPPNVRLRTMYASVKNIGNGVSCDACVSGCDITYIYK